MPVCSDDGDGDGAHAQVRASSAHVRSSQVGAVAQGFSEFCSYSTNALVIYFGGWEITRGLTDFEALFKSFAAVLMAAVGLTSVGGPWWQHKLSDCQIWPSALDAYGEL